MSMFTNDYLLAWTLYGVGALGCLLVGVRLTRPCWWWLREPLRLALAVLLLTPTLVDAERGLYAPALAITALDLAFQVGSSSLQAVVDLAMFGLVAFSLYGLLVAGRWMIRRGRKQPAADREPANRRAHDDDRLDHHRPLAGRGRTEPRL